MMNYLSSPSVLRACLLGTILGSATASNADVLLSDWTDQDHFYYYLNHMPDFDQKRCEDLEPSIEGLGNDGNNHCVPTATTNVLKYIAQHGFPHIDPGPASWDFDSSYNPTGVFIEALGNDMDTDPWGGTSYDDYYAEIVNRLQCEFVVKLYVAEDEYSPNFKGLARSATNGHLILVRYGYYSDQGMEDGYKKISRSGGHMTTFMQAWGWEGTEIMTVRDPATGGDDCYSQSNYAGRSWHVEDQPVQVNGSQRTQSYLYEDGDYSGSNRYLDGYISIIPNRFYSWGEFDNGIRITAPTDVIFGHGVNPLIEAPTSWTVRDFILDPRGLGSLALIEHNEQRVLAELGPDDTMIPLNMVSEQLKNPRFACLVGGTMCSIDEGQMKWFKRVANTDTWNMSGATEVQSPPAAMVADGSRNGAFTIHPSTRTITYWPNPRAGDSPRDFDMPNEAAFEGDVILRVNPSTNELLAWSTARRDLWSFSWDEHDQVMSSKQQLLPDMETITHIDVDDLGRLLVARSGKISAYTRGEQGAWLHDSVHCFNGLELGANKTTFTMLRSSTNVRGELDATELDNMPDTPGEGAASNEVADCNADLNFDRDVDINDLLTLLSKWGGSGGLGDIVHDNSINVMDLLALIEAWGSCD